MGTTLGGTDHVTGSVQLIPKTPVDPNAPPVRIEIDHGNHNRIVADYSRKKAAEKEAARAGSGAFVDERERGKAYLRPKACLQDMQQVDSLSEQADVDTLLSTGEVESARDANGQLWVVKNSFAQWLASKGQARLPELRRDRTRAKNDATEEAQNGPKGIRKKMDAEYLAALDADEELKVAIRQGGDAVDRLRAKRAAEAE